MVRLRNEVLRKTHTADLARVINAIRGQVVDLLNGGSIRMRDMIDVVNHIRRFPDLFPGVARIGDGKTIFATYI